MLTTSLLVNIVPGKTYHLEPELKEFVSAPKVRELLAGIPNLKVRRILTDLIKCESNGDPNALNPKDKDSTPSYGLLQFKTKTLYSEGKRYNIINDIEPREILNIIYFPEIQIKVAAEMIKNNKDNINWWKQQFPACAKKYDYWK